MTAKKVGGQMPSDVNERTRRSKERVVGLFSVALLVVLASCTSGSTGSVTVPTQDLTPPMVVLDLVFPQGQIFTVTSAGFNPTLPPAELNGGEEISLVARCTDADGGCQNILIFVDVTTIASDGSVTRQVSTLAESPDPGAKPGGTALTERLVSGKLDIPQLRGSASALRLNLTARAVNANGATDTTRQLTLFWSRQVPLVVPACPRFSPVGLNPPMVLDSRRLSVEILNLMNTKPTQTTFTIVMLPPNVPTGYTLKITTAEGAPPPGGPTRAAFRLMNSGLGVPTLQATTVDSRDCGKAGQIVTAAPGSASAFIEADITNTTTIVFSTVGGSDIAVWNEIPFWQAFGGRTTTFEWFGSP